MDSDQTGAVLSGFIVFASQIKLLLTSKVHLNKKWKASSEQNINSIWAKENYIFGKKRVFI